jgi:hypothetical protein
MVPGQVQRSPLIRGYFIRNSQSPKSAKKQMMKIYSNLLLQRESLRSSFTISPTLCQSQHKFLNAKLEADFNQNHFVTIALSEINGSLNEA